MAETLSELVVKVGSDTQEFKNGMQDVQGGMKTTSDKIAGYANTAANALAGIGVALGALAVDFGKSAIADQKFNAQVESLTGSAKGAEKAFKSLGDAMANEKIAATEDDLKAVVLQLSKFKADIGTTMPAVLDLAAATGNSADSIASLFGQLAAGNERAVLQLRNQYGIMKEDIEKFSKDGKVSIEALVAYINDKYAGSMERFADTTGGKLIVAGKAWDTFKDEAGKAVLEAVDPLLQKGMELIKQFDELDPKVKQAAGEWVVYGTGITLTLAGITKMVLFVRASVIPLFATQIPAALAKTNLALIGIKGTLTALGLSFAAVGVAASAMALVTLKEMKKANDAAWDLKKRIMDDRQMAAEVTGYMDLDKFQGKTASYQAQLLSERGYKKEDIVQAKAGISAQISTEKDPIRKSQLEEQGKLLHEIAGAYDDATKAIEAQSKAVDNLTTAEHKQKEIEHKLKMGQIDKINAAGEYMGVITQLQQEIPNVYNDEKKRMELNEKIWAAQERRKELGGDALDTSGYKNYFPSLPGGGKGRSRAADIEAFKSRVGITSAGTSPTLTGLPTSAGISEAAAPYTPISRNAYLNQKRTTWAEYQAEQGKLQAQKRDDYLRGGVTGGSTVASRLAESGATAPEQQKILIQLMINEETTSDYRQGNLAVQARVSTDENYKQATG